MENEICLANHTLLSIHEKYRNACPLELEHIEICFKPKEKYMGAFEKLQQLFPLIKRISIKNVETCEYEDEFLDLCKNYLNAIDLETGELNMLNLLQQFEGVVTGIDVKRFVKDNDLKKEVLEALEALYEADEVEVENKYFYEMSTVTIEQIMLNDYILDGEKTAHIILSILDLNDLTGVGKILGTLAEEITNVVYIDSRECEELYTAKKFRKFEQLEFRHSESEKELVIRDARVPKQEVYTKFILGEPCYKDEIIVDDLVIKLFDMDNKYHVSAMINIEPAYQPFIAKMVEIYETTVAAYEAGVLKFDDFMGVSSQNKLYATELLFDILNYDYDVCSKAMDDLHFFFSMRMNNREYKLEEVFGNIEDEKIYDVITSKPESDFVTIFNVDFAKEDVLSSIGNIEINQVDAEGKQWKFEADFNYAFEKSLRQYFNGILQNIGSNDDPGVLEITRL